MNSLPQELLERVLMFALQTPSGCLQEITKLRAVCRRFDDTILGMQISYPTVRMALTLCRGLQQIRRIEWPHPVGMVVGVTPRGLRVLVSCDEFGQFYTVQRLDGTSFQCRVFGHLGVTSVHDFGDGVCVKLDAALVHLSPEDDMGRLICRGYRVLSTYAYNKGFLLTYVDVDYNRTHFMVTPAKPAGVLLPLLTGHRIIAYDGVVHTLFEDALYTYDGVELKKSVDGISTMYPTFTYSGRCTVALLYRYKERYINVIPTRDGIVVIKGPYHITMNGPFIAASSRKNNRLFYKGLLLMTFRGNVPMYITDKAIVCDFKTHLEAVTFMVTPDIS